MKNLIKKVVPNRQVVLSYTSLLISLIIGSFIFFWTNNFYTLTFKSGDADFIKSVIGSFAGAFFAFLFLRIGEILEKYYQRQVKHFNALVSMEIFFNELGTIVHDNIYLLPTFRATINTGNVYASKLRPLPIRKDYYEQLNDIKLINDLYKLNYDIRRINDDLESANEWYVHLRQIYTTGQMQPEHYIVNAKILSENLKVIEASLTLLLDDIVRLNAITTIKLDTDKPLLTRFMHYILEKIAQEVTSEQIEQKMKDLKDEIAESGKDSQPRIEKIKLLASKMQ